MWESQDLNLGNSVSNEFSLFFYIWKLATAPCSSSTMHILIGRCKVRFTPVTYTFLHASCRQPISLGTQHQESRTRDIPGGPVVKAPCFQCRGPGFDPWLGTTIPHAACGAAKRKEKERKQEQSPSFPYLNNFCNPGFIFRSNQVDIKLRMTNAN